MSARSPSAVRGRGRPPRAPVIGLHRRLPAWVASCVVACAVSGCAADSLVLAPPAPDIPFQPATPAVVDGQPGVLSAPLTTPSGARNFGLPPMSTLPVGRAEPAIDPARVYTLADLIDLAQVGNPETRIAWEQAREAALAVGMARSLYLPTISATVVGGKQYQSMSSTTQTMGTTGSTNLNSDITGTVSSAALQWLIFDFGARDALSLAAQRRSLAADIAFNGTHQKIIYDVSRRFFDYTSARQAAAIAGRTRASSAELYEAARERANHGRATVVEVAQARQLLAQADSNLVRAQGSERDGYQALLTAVGISPAARMRIEDVSSRPLAPASMVPVDRLVAEALKRRPDIQAAFASAQAVRAGIAQAEAEFLPKIFMTASGSYITGGISVTGLPSVGSLTGGNSTSGASATSLNGSNATILGGIAIPIYDGGLREGKLLTARAQADAAEAGVVRQQQNAASEIVSADNALRTSLSAYRADGVLVDASATARDAAYAAYRTGTGSITSAIEAERSLLSARLSREQAHGTALIAAATLAFATGRLSSSDAVAFRIPPAIPFR